MHVRIIMALGNELLGQYVLVVFPNPIGYRLVSIAVSRILYCYLLYLVWDSYLYNYLQMPYGRFFKKNLRRAWRELFGSLKLRRSSTPKIFEFSIITKLNWRLSLIASFLTHFPLLLFISMLDVWLEHTHYIVHLTQKKKKINWRSSKVKTSLSFGG